MYKGYLSLSDDFSLKRSESASILFNLKNGTVFDLLSDQEEFISMLDGTKTLTRILSQYSPSSKPAVLRLIEEMNGISAIRFSQTPAFKNTPRNRVPENRLEAVHLEASGECNMRCAHCYQMKYVKTGERLNWVELMALLDELERMQVCRVSISGGEPLMMFDLLDLLAEIEKREMKISAIFTNGLLVNRDIIKAIKNLRSIFSFFVSLDSLPGKEFNFRGFSGKSSEKILNGVINGLNMLVENGISVVVNTVVNIENIEYLDEMYDFIKVANVASWRLGFPKMTPQFKQHSARFNVEWALIAERCLILLERHLKGGMPFPIQMEYLFREELFKQGLIKLSPNDFVCDYEGRRTELCIKPNGDVVSCAYCTDLPIGNIRNSSLWDIWYSQKMKNVKSIKIGDVAECRECDIRDICATGCRANAFFLHGDFKNAKDDYACLAVAFFKERVFPLLKKYQVV